MDINCGVCAEPWENYELRKEMNADSQNWNELNAALMASKQLNSKETPYTWFMAGKGCPACKFGMKKPIFDGQTYKAIAAYEVIGIEADSEVKVEAFVQEYGSFKMTVSFSYKNQDGAPMRADMPEVEFRRKFELVPSEKDKERQEEIFLKAAESACEASDEDPVEILAKRGIM